jgi:hypothetical protein
MGRANRPKPDGRKVSGNVVATQTINVMLSRVADANMSVTIISNQLLPEAAGYISKGISGSHGPKRNIVNRIQGVMAGRVGVDDSLTCA